MDVGHWLALQLGVGHNGDSDGVIVRLLIHWVLSSSLFLANFDLRVLGKVQSPHHGGSRSRRSSLGNYWCQELPVGLGRWQIYGFGLTTWLREKDDDWLWKCFFYFVLSCVWKILFEKKTNINVLVFLLFSLTYRHKSGFLLAS